MSLAGRDLARRLGLAALVAAAASPLAAERSITPYIDVQQVLDADLNGGGDVLTYTALAAGVDAAVSNRQVNATVSYRYERRIPWNNHLDNQDVHTGLARASVRLATPLTLDAGAIATRTRSDIRGAAPVFLTGNSSNISQVYGGYVGPTLSTTAGPLQIGASYQLGYVRADDKTDIALAADQPRLDTFDHAVSQSASASVGMARGTLPFGWTVSGGWQREDVGQLDQRFEGKNARLDVVVPVASTLAVTGGVGYENIEVGQRLPVRDADGLPVLDSHGRYITDKSSPRLLAYDTDGLIYDGGIIWRPNRRTTLVARAGHRYGGTTVVGSLDWRVSRHSGLRVDVYDGIQSFGRLLTQNLNTLPTGFDVPNNPLIDNRSGCVFGTTPGSGGCLNSSFQSLNANNFRNRGVTAVYTLQQGLWAYGVGGGYAQRKYVAPEESGFVTFDGVKDESWYVQGYAARELSERSGINLAVYGQWYDSDLAGADQVSAYGLTGSYYHTFGQRLTGQASAGVYTYGQDGGSGDDVRGQLLLGLRYQF